MRRVWCVLLLFLAVVPVRATVLVPADLRELTRDAEAIVRGVVVALDSRWLDGRRGIETIVTLDTEIYLKGALGETVQFRVAGGTLGRFRNVVVGAPQFAVGQRVIVFLGARAPSVPFVLGLNQGVYRLARTASGDVVTPPAIVPAATPVSRGSRYLTPSPLAEFEARVRSFAREVQ